MLFKEFQATLWEEVQRNADAYLSRSPTERSTLESQRATEAFHRTLAKNLYREFEIDMKRKLADIQNGVPDEDDLVDNRDMRNNSSPDVEEYQQPIPAGRQTNSHLPEVCFQFHR